MTNSELTKDERLCLQLWFRQAIADVEKEEVKNFLLKQYPPELDRNGATNHRKSLVRRRTYRGQNLTHSKVLAY